MTNKQEWVGTTGLKQLLLMLVGFIYLLWQWQVMQRIKGFSYRSKYQICRCCPNAVKESRSERVGFYRNEQGGFCLPGTSEDNIESSSVSTITSSVSRLSRGDKYRQHRREHNQCNAQYDAWSWHGKMNVFWANVTSNRLNEVGLNTRFKFKLHMWLFKCHLLHLP